MKKWLFVLAVVMIIASVMTGCPSEVETKTEYLHPELENYPYAAIMGVAYNNGSTENAKVVPHADGTYDITVKTRLPASGAYTYVYFNGGSFMEQYSLVIDLPANSAVKPNRVYAFAAKGTNDSGANWSRAWDSVVTKPGVTAHTGEYTIDNGDTPLPTLRIDSSTQYKTIVLSLYWPNTITEIGDYTFKLKSLKAKPYVYKDPPPAPFLVELQTYLSDDAAPWGDTTEDGFKYPPTDEDPNNVPLNQDIPINLTLATKSGKWEFFNIQLNFPGDAVGRTYEFTISNVGAYVDSTNLINNISTVSSAWGLSGGPTITSQENGVYKVKVSNIDSDGGTGGLIRIYFGGFNGNNDSGQEIGRFTITLNLPDQFVTTTP
jgi:hypothetical protein